MAKVYRSWDVDQGWLLPPSPHALVPLIDDVRAHLRRKPCEVSGDAGLANEAKMAARLKRAGRRSRYRLRKQVVEPVFGQIKQARGFQRAVFGNAPPEKFDLLSNYWTHEACDCRSTIFP